MTTYKEVWIIQIPSGIPELMPTDEILSSSVCEIYDDFDLFMDRRIELKKQYPDQSPLVVVRHLMVNTKYY